jgi:hypothetical protein
MKDFMRLIVVFLVKFLVLFMLKNIWLFSSTNDESVHIWMRQVASFLIQAVFYRRVLLLFIRGGRWRWHYLLVASCLYWVIFVIIQGNTHCDALQLFTDWFFRAGRLNLFLSFHFLQLLGMLFLDLKGHSVLLLYLIHDIARCWIINFQFWCPLRSHTLWPVLYL